jgi:BirA family transcriptional regulator, biotin operon repressor / biotin---[acetyl-CoA-carboxylase] ligase
MGAKALRRAVLDGTGPWVGLDVVAATGSTNADLAARARAGTAGHGWVLAADHQDAGRGRRGRSWTAPPRSAIAVSVLVRPGFRPEERPGARPGSRPPEGPGERPGARPGNRPGEVPVTAWSWLPLLAGLAVTDALVRVCGLDARLKWPNDVLIDGRKVAGVLAEVVEHLAGSAVVLGIGLNVSQTQDELPVPAATSLRLAGASTTDRDVVLRAVLRALGDRYTSWQGAGGDPRASGIGAGYRERCATLGLAVRVSLPQGTDLTGTAEGVDDAGRLLVRDEGGLQHVLAAGDVGHVRSVGGPGTA